jgi:hypothetical protein
MFHRNNNAVSDYLVTGEAVKFEAFMATEFNIVFPKNQGAG